MERLIKALILTGTATSASLLAMQVGAVDAPTGGDPRVRAFVLSNIFMASSDEAGTCPALNSDSLEIFRRSLSPAEQAKYANLEAGDLARVRSQHLGFKVAIIGSRTSNGTPTKVPPGFDPSAPMTLELARQIGALNGFPEGRGRPAWNGKWIVYSSCSNPEDFPELAEGYQTYSGKVAPGSDLDGKNGRNNFIGLDGRKGVDNQLWRAAGCVKAFRDDGNPANAKTTILSAAAPTVVVLRDVDDLQTDSDITVEFYAANEALQRGADGRVLAGTTFTTKADPRFRATTRGRIVNGVLTTDPVDLTMQYKEQIIENTKEFRGARIRIAFTNDGGIEGSIDGYYTLASFWDYMEQRTEGSTEVSGYTCPGVRQAIDRFADGYRDPKTGRFTAISSSYGFLGTRAFVETPMQTAGREIF